MTRLADALLRANRQNQLAASAAATALATPESEPAQDAAAPSVAPVGPVARAASPAPVVVAPAAPVVLAPVVVPIAPVAPVAAAPAPAAPVALAAAAPVPAAAAAPVARVAPAVHVAVPPAAKPTAPAAPAAVPKPPIAPARPVAASASNAPAASAAPRPAGAKRAPAWSREASIEKPIVHAAPTGSSLIAVPASADQLTLWRSDPETAGKLVGTDGFLPSAMEQYRKLAAILHHAQMERGLKVIMTSSAMPGEGKSLTSVNLALTLSDSYRKRVLLIDVDLRRPTVQRIFGLPPVGGLTEALTADEDRQIVLTRVSDSLFVLPAGRPESDPMSGLTSDRMKRVLAQAASHFDWVLVDSPPVGLLPDASLLATLVDGVLLVIRSGKAPFPLVKRAVEIITHQRILGVVMNAIDFKHDRNAGGYYEYYGAGYYGAPSTK
ncbi:MAG: hypothetical protein DMF93_08695 [Acidobacteria bacterium]|nr:MAG: hypothetical protein DMF93_08695 [Acidobacteriota bacterium]